MSFQSDKQKAHQWQQWLQRHQAKLVDCGVPPSLLESKKHWFYFLDHGYFTPTGSAEPIIDIDRMAKTDAEGLWLFLESDDLHPRSAALNRLQYLLKRGQP